MSLQGFGYGSGSSSRAKSALRVSTQNFQGFQLKLTVIKIVKTNARIPLL